MLEIDTQQNTIEMIHRCSSSKNKYNTVAAFCNAHAFESAHPQSCVIAHKLLICRFEVNFLIGEILLIYIFIFNKIFLILAVMSTFIASLSLNSDLCLCNLIAAIIMCLGYKYTTF